MIPWTAFGSTEYPDWRIELNEHNLYHYVVRGPSQLTRGLDSSMLEQAHERQFAISQLGLTSAGFEMQHTARVDLALQTVFHHFSSHPLDESYRPTSPYTEHLADLRLSGCSSTFEPLPPFEMEHPSRYQQRSPPPSPTLTAGKPSRSPLALQDLMNPEPIGPRPGKRKYSDSWISPVVDGDNLDNLLELDNDILYQNTLDYVRANQSHPPKVTRTHREARMRRPSPSRFALRRHPTQRTCETEQAEKEAHLLLSLSQDYARAAS